LKAARKKQQVTNKGKLIRITGDLSAETQKSKESMNDVFQAESK
jgi:hypothetical protein